MEHWKYWQFIEACVKRNVELFLFLVFIEKKIVLTCILNRYDDRDHFCHNGVSFAKTNSFFVSKSFFKKYYWK